ncbi:MAG: CPXCG motif-containing cysteine-rich protein [Planctomycetes bacterium]|nr:CPXCG motif-containing cysteine-rich protein [Planctomycetota bacterium]
MDEIVEVACPSCGEPIVLALDPSAGSEQEYVEDCPVCCRPALHRVRFDREGRASVDSRAE